MDLHGILKYDEPLAPYTAWRVGGLADVYYRPANLLDLVKFLATLSPTQPITWLGLGSNVLISDAGIRGAVIHLLSVRGASANPAQMSIEQTPDGGIVRAEAGIPAARLAKYCANHGLSGLEFLAGIPGTVGGALAMNAGAWGGETWRQVLKVEVMDRNGQILMRTPHDHHIGYRTVYNHAREEWFVSGYFRVQRCDVKEGIAKIKALLQERNAKQPTGVFSCGSVFKNPEHISAGSLIEACQLKGFAIGDAQVSLKHGNFILNRGRASAADILNIIAHIQEVVWRDQGIQLDTEVRMMGGEG